MGEIGKQHPIIVDDAVSSRLAPGALRKKLARRPEFKYKQTLGGFFGLRMWDNWGLTAAQLALLLAIAEENTPPEKKAKKGKGKVPMKRMSPEQLESIKRQAKQEQESHGTAPA